MRCLLVDDEPGIREGLAALLRRKGHEVRTAGDCEAAAAAIAAQHVDIVITDWRLPDGTAARFVAGCACPVVAISGHPEEVDALPALCATLTKPVAPSKLLEVLALSTPPAPATAIEPLPIDVQRIVGEVCTHLPADARVELFDDGPFVLLEAEPAVESALPALEALGGDLRILSSDGHQRLELRLCRDGRPDVDVPVVGPDDAWPDAEVFAVDFHDTRIPVARFFGCLDRVAACRANGQRVHFLNVPDRLCSAATDQGRAHDMPMKARVGPRLPAVFADLWSQP